MKYRVFILHTVEAETSHEAIVKAVMTQFTQIENVEAMLIADDDIKTHYPTMDNAEQPVEQPQQTNVHIIEE